MSSPSPRQKLLALALDFEAKDWTVLDGLFTLRELQVSVSKQLGGGPESFQASFLATSTLGKAQLRCGGNYPSGDVYFKMQADEPLKLTDLGSSIFGGAAARETMAGPLTSFGLSSLDASANIWSWSLMTKPRTCLSAS